MASSLDSLDPAGSPAKPGSSIIHLCMSVKRTLSGSVSGYLSASAMARSSKSSQVNVCGMGLLLPNLVTLESPKALVFDYSSHDRYRNPRRAFPGVSHRAAVTTHRPLSPQ